MVCEEWLCLTALVLRQNLLSKCNVPVNVYREVGLKGWEVGMGGSSAPSWYLAGAWGLRQLQRAFKGCRAGYPLLEVTQPLGMSRPPLPPSDTHSGPKETSSTASSFLPLILWPGPQEKGSLCDLKWSASPLPPSFSDSLCLFLSLCPSFSLPDCKIGGGGHWTREPHRL